MEGTHLTPRGRPRAAARAEAQRTRILDAAKKCFVEQGFHAAAMATIAETAGVSAGLIYRYFASKDAIVLAIIERDLHERRARIATLHTSVDLAGRLIDTFRELRSGAPQMFSSALFLEVSAEATRVPQIAAAVKASDRLTRGDLQAWLSRKPPEGGIGLDKKEAEARALLMQILVEGLAVRAAREPGLEAGRLRQALEQFLGCFRETG